MKMKSTNNIVMEIKMISKDRRDLYGECKKDPTYFESFGKKEIAEMKSEIHKLKKELAELKMNSAIANGTARAVTIIYDNRGRVRRGENI